MKYKITPTNKERVMREHDFIVSKTDPSGRLTYCNQIFIEFAGYTEAELLGRQHNIVRHPDMPRSVFYLLWQTIKSGNEFIGYVKNLSKDGSFYWVLATVTPSFNTQNKNDKQEIIGFFSVRRKPDPNKLRVIESLYKDMLAAERQAGSRNAIAAGTKVLEKVIQPTGKDYREFIISL